MRSAVIRKNLGVQIQTDDAREASATNDRSVPPRQRPTVDVDDESNIN